MFKRKPARSGKARSSSKIRSKAARSGQHTNLIAMVSNWRSVTPLARWRIWIWCVMRVRAAQVSVLL
jgi:hypothetical protein